MGHRLSHRLGHWLGLGWAIRWAIRWDRLSSAAPRTQGPTYGSLTLPSTVACILRPRCLCLAPPGIGALPSSSAGSSSAGATSSGPFAYSTTCARLPPQPPRTRHLAHDLGRASITAHPPTPLLPPSRLLPHTLRLTPCSSLLCVAQLAAPLALERSWLRPLHAVNLRWRL